MGPAGGHPAPDALRLFCLPPTWDAPDSTAGYIAASTIIAVANGLSSGVLMTLAADLAPQHDPAPFLGSWRTLVMPEAQRSPCSLPRSTLLPHSRLR